jgi:dTDP-glucose 4,6-dehydratase
VLDYAVACGTKRILLTSSGGVYGKMPAAMERIPDDFMGIPDPLDTKNTYGIAKRAAEHLCAIYAAQFDLSIVVARCFAFIGRDLPMNVHFAIGNFIHDAVKKNEITVNGDGSPMRSYLDQRDLAEWLVALLERGASGAAYNVGSDMSLSLKELAYLVRDLISPGKNVRIMGRAACNSERNIYVPDIAKITRHLGVSQRYTLKQSIKDAAESLK